MPLDIGLHSHVVSFQGGERNEKRVDTLADVSRLRKALEEIPELGGQGSNI